MPGHTGPDEYGAFSQRRANQSELVFQQAEGAGYLDQYISIRSPGRLSEG